MDNDFSSSDDPPPDPPGARSSCSCSCLCCSSPSSSWSRSIKRKLHQLDEQQSSSSLLQQTNNNNNIYDFARVEITNEAVALREALGKHHQSIQDLHAELEEERNAASSAASEAMSMILRLQREKAEAQMEFRQFKRFAEEKMSHDQEEIAQLEDLLFKREQAVQSLSYEIQAYKHRMISYGFGPTLSEPQTPDTATSAGMGAFDYYPQLKINIPADVDNEEDAMTDLDKYAFGETPRNLEQRIVQMERMPSSVHEKGVVGYSPRMPKGHLRRLSVDSYGSCSFIMKGDDRASEVSDRVYTVDAVHGAPEDYVSTPREFGNGRMDVGGGAEDEEMKRLYARMQALEADRESMRQTIMSMGTDKAQLVLLKEIAQQLCKEVTPQKKVAKKPSTGRSFSIISAIKWITSVIFWRKKSSRTKYTFGIGNSVGLLLLLEKSPRMKQRRCLTRMLR